MTIAITPNTTVARPKIMAIVSVTATTQHQTNSIKKIGNGKLDD
jgi:hypothetical protein